ncbi:hypothetical protein B0O99DRAFT_616401 [Bisporella sp. PMI_857]|nr:hypothetical protein B0O99DRAFT_616401 [Bisporella sp. PMI_857]
MFVRTGTMWMECSIIQHTMSQQNSSPASPQPRWTSYTNDQCEDRTLLGSISENHDQARFAHETNGLTLIKTVVVLTMLQDGTPIVYQGQEQHFSGAADPYDREVLWP